MVLAATYFSLSQFCSELIHLFISFAELFSPLQPLFVVELLTLDSERFARSENIPGKGERKKYGAKISVHHIEMTERLDCDQLSIK